MQDVELQLRRFIIDSFLFGDADYRLSNDDSFLEQNIIDSTGILELVMFIETQYGIKISDSELVPDNLDSIARLVRFIGRKIQMTEECSSAG